MSSAATLDRQLAAINQKIYANNFSEAMEEAEHLRNIAESNRAATALLALAAACSGDRDRAIAVLDEFGQEELSDRAEVLLAAGSTWFKLGEMPPAIRLLALAITTEPEHPLATARLGACLLAVGRVHEALPHLKKAAELMTNSGGSWLNLGRGLLMADRVDEAMEALDRAEPLKDKEENIYRMTRAEALYRSGEPDAAEQLLRRSLELKQEGAVAALSTQLAARGRYDDAWQVLREALDQTPEDVKLLEMAAELAQVRGRFGEAERLLNLALANEPDNAGLWIRRAMLSSRRLGMKKGREAADRALELTIDEQGSTRAHALSAHAHLLADEERYVEAEAAYREALKIFPIWFCLRPVRDRRAVGGSSAFDEPLAQGVPRSDSGG